MKQMKGNKNGRMADALRFALLILPAVALGILAMIHSGVSPALWGQQAAAWALLGLMALPLRRAVRRIALDVRVWLLLLTLAVSLLGKEAGGARRWVNLGVFNANAAMLILPALLVMLGGVKFPCSVLMAAAAVMAFQPDFSQLTAFCAASLPILLIEKKERRHAPVCVLLFAVLLVCCVRIPVSLEPLAYCEGILILLGDMSPLLALCGYLSLAAIPAFWLIRFFANAQRPMLSLFAYYAVIMFFAFFGNEPVPFSGFGLSPIAGYYLAWICMPEKQEDATASKAAAE